MCVKNQIGIVYKQWKLMRAFYLIETDWMKYPIFYKRYKKKFVKYIFTICHDLIRSHNQVKNLLRFRTTNNKFPDHE